MVGATVVQLEGFDQLEKNLMQLTKATGKNVLRRVGKGALEPMADIAAHHAPYRTGKLSYSISVSEKRTARAKRNTTKFKGGSFRADPTKTIEIAMGPAAGNAALNYASFDEFGTVDTPAFAYMRTAWDTGANQALEYVKENLWREIDKATIRYFKKIGRM